MPTYNLRWQGYITHQNIEQVAELLREFLADKVYTFVTSYAGSWHKPNVHTGLKVRPVLRSGTGPIEVLREQEDDSYTIRVRECHVRMRGANDSWDCTTYTPSDPQTTEERVATPHIKFEENKVTITKRDIGGNKLFWVIAIEQQSFEMRDFVETLQRCLQSPDMPAELKERLQRAAENAELIKV